MAGTGVATHAYVEGRIANDNGIGRQRVCEATECQHRFGVRLAVRYILASHNVRNIRSYAQLLAEGFGGMMAAAGSDGLSVAPAVEFGEYRQNTLEQLCVGNPFGFEQFAVKRHSTVERFAT